MLVVLAMRRPGRTRGLRGVPGRQLREVRQRGGGPAVLIRAEEVRWRGGGCAVVHGALGEPAPRGDGASGHCGCVSVSPPHLWYVFCVCADFETLLGSEFAGSWLVNRSRCFRRGVSVGAIPSRDSFVPSVSLIQDNRHGDVERSTDTSQPPYSTRVEARKGVNTVSRRRRKKIGRK